MCCDLWNIWGALGTNSKSYGLEGLAIPIRHNRLTALVRPHTQKESKGAKMKNLVYALSASVAWSAVAMAQTDTPATSGDRFGTSWPLSIGTTFFTGEGNATLQTGDELRNGWQSLSQADRDMIEADCQAFNEEHGLSDAEGAGDASVTITNDGVAADTESSVEGSAEVADGTETAPDSSVDEPGYDLVEMRAICDAVAAF
jgi:hypothetical protein